MSARKGNDMFQSGISKWLFILLALIILSTATAAQTNNCCSVDRQCTTNEDWTAGYYAIQNGQCAAPSQQRQSSSAPPQPQPAPAENVDNCCFVDRQCATDEDWVNGYNAYQSNQCGSPTQQQQSQPRQSQQTPSHVNNCCFIGWQCESEQEWISGYFAFQHQHCAMQSHWDEQWRRRQIGNQQRSSANQPRSSGTRSRNDSNQQGRASSDPQPDSNQQEQAHDGSHGPVEISTNDEIGTEYQRQAEDGTSVTTTRLTHEEFWAFICRAWPDLGYRECQ